MVDVPAGPGGFSVGLSFDPVPIRELPGRLAAERTAVAVGAFDPEPAWRLPAWA